MASIAAAAGAATANATQSPRETPSDVSDVVDAAESSDPREGRELILATKPWSEEDRARSWYYTITTFGFLAALLVAAAVVPWWPVRLVFSLVAALTIVRGFILYHDFLHGAILRKSKIAKPFFALYGILLLTPRRVWKETHNYHHAHTAKLVGSHIGSYQMVSTRMWRRMSPAQKRMYKLMRHPLTIFFGFFTLFLGGMCLSAFKRNPRKNWDSGLAPFVHVGLAFAIGLTLGWDVYLFACFLPLFFAMAVGAYLFYAQHNYPEVDIKTRAEWSYTHAALESSSYMEMGPVMAWFTGNIGYHHVHHLNPQIPFYRLPEVMQALPELQQPGTTSLRPKDIVRCFQLKLWDPRTGEMVGYPDE